MNDLEQQIATLESVVLSALDFAKQQGATGVEVAASANVGLNVDVRMQAPETIEHFRDKSFGITVYVGQKSGSASTTDTRPESIRKMVAAACQIAHHTEADPCAGLPDPETLATHWPDNLSLYHPWEITAEAALQKAMACEAIALQADPAICNSEGATVHTSSGIQVYGNSLGFLQAFKHSRHSLSCAVIAEKKGRMQRDSSYTVARDFRDLESMEIIAKEAARKTIERLDPRRLNTCEAPVLFVSEVATSLINHFLRAISGSSLYRKTSFLLDHLGKPIFPEKCVIVEDPFVIKGLASCPYDAEGVAVQARTLIDAGILQGYLLDSYSARQMGLKTTGNAGGAHNVVVSHDDLNFPALLAEMDTGLLVTDVLGQGVNIITGDYSRGVSGFWVQGGKIQYPVEEITIAGNLKEMYQGIVAIGNDLEKRGKVRCGSILIDRMRVAGE